jgi:hypothetical protein
MALFLVAILHKSEHAKGEGERASSRVEGFAGLPSREMVPAPAENTSGLTEPQWTGNGTIEMAL